MLIWLRFCTRQRKFKHSLIHPAEIQIQLIKRQTVVRDRTPLSLQIGENYSLHSVDNNM